MESYISQNFICNSLHHRQRLSKADPFLTHNLFVQQVGKGSLKTNKPLPNPHNLNNGQGMMVTDGVACT